ncbi:membrane protein insertion efficiency factor YidD [Nocardioides sp. ChNu-99]|uniref:membrane protein insertion efficiency factor YidD n=1 Tax=Nocardioides sp. ChNu-99 TaxID=2839897 RepID=UPI0024074867|nr:membrane protein insertion efficiency factor YidD [Nocardioides sp. ChNu-99]MDF9717616.1 membrane protein insertion efficiency factor YidD [Nocardioides sp. ChNu-99]
MGVGDGLQAWRRRRRHDPVRRQRRARRKKRRDDCIDCSDCGCTSLDCLSVMTVTVLLRTLLGAFAPGAVDPHTPPPRSWGARVAARGVRSYQLHVSPRRAAPVCNLTPSCSRYGLQALSAHGLVRGGVLVGRRLAACRAAGHVGRS